MNSKNCLLHYSFTLKEKDIGFSITKVTKKGEKFIMDYQKSEALTENQKFSGCVELAEFGLYIIQWHNNYSVL